MFRQCGFFFLILLKQYHAQFDLQSTSWLNIYMYWCNMWRPYHCWMILILNQLVLRHILCVRVLVNDALKCEKKYIVELCMQALIKFSVLRFNKFCVVRVAPLFTSLYCIVLCFCFILFVFILCLVPSVVCVFEFSINGYSIVYFSSNIQSQT